MERKILFPDETVIKTKLFDVSQDWEIPIPAFFIIAPLRKVSSIAEFTEDEAVEFITLARKIRKGMKEVLGIKCVYLFEREDTERNFHFWIFPRYEWMEKFGRGIESVRPIITYAKDTMTDEENMNEVRDCVKKLKEYMKNDFY